MRRLLRFGLLGALLAVPLSGCYVHTRDRVVAQPGVCASSAWVEGHYDVHGRWVPGYWRCERVVY